MIKKIDNLRKSSIESAYSLRMGEKLDSKLKRSGADIKEGRTHSQNGVEAYFKNRFDQ